MKDMNCKWRKLRSGNYMGYYAGHYIFLRKREHGKWDGFDKYVSWWTGYIGRNGEWLYSEGVFTSYLKTLRKAKRWALNKLNSNLKPNE